MTILYGVPLETRSPKNRRVPVCGMKWAERGQAGAARTFCWLVTGTDPQL